MGAESAGAPSVTAAKPPGMARVGATVALYLALNSSLNLLNRYTLGHAGFRFPVTLTCAHLCFQICSLAPLVHGRRDVNHAETLARCWKGLAAIGSFMAINISLNNASLLHLSLSYNQIIRASIPVVCALCAIFVENKIPTGTEILGLVLVAVGVMATVVGSASNAVESRPNETVGLLFCGIATVSNALMMTFSGRIMGGEKLDALRLTFYTSPVVLAILAPVALTTEWSKMIRRLGEPAPLEDADGSGTFVTGTTLLQLVLLGCFNAVAYNWVHNKVIAATSATTTTVLGNVKVAMLVLFSRILFGETKDWSWGMAGGAGVALAGFAMYSFAKLRAMRRAAAASEK